MTSEITDVAGNLSGNTINIWCTGCPNSFVLLSIWLPFNSQWAQACIARRQAVPGAVRRVDSRIASTAARCHYTTSRSCRNGDSRLYSKDVWQRTCHIKPDNKAATLCLSPSACSLVHPMLHGHSAARSGMTVSQSKRTPLILSRGASRLSSLLLPDWEKSGWGEGVFVLVRNKPFQVSWRIVLFLPQA
jgi:hypothetical protein